MDAPLLCRLAVSFGWVRLLRRLQPAGKNDFLVAKVLLPAAVVERAQLAASNPIQASPKWLDFRLEAKSSIRTSDLMP